MKGLFLAYNKDMQEDKEPFFNALDTFLSCLTIMFKMIATMKVKHVNECEEVADYLISKGLAFRDAHSTIGSIVIYCEDHQKMIEELPLEELKQFTYRRRHLYDH